MRRFQALRCARSVAEQRYIWARCLAYEHLRGEDQAEIRALAADVAAGAGFPIAGAALLRILTAGVSPDAESARSGLPRGALYAMQREFYERAVI